MFVIAFFFMFWVISASFSVNLVKKITEKSIKFNQSALLPSDWIDYFSESIFFGCSLYLFFLCRHLLSDQINHQIKIYSIHSHSACRRTRRTWCASLSPRAWRRWRRRVGGSWRRPTPCAGLRPPLRLRCPLPPPRLLLQLWRRRRQQRRQRRRQRRWQRPQRQRRRRRLLSRHRRLPRMLAAAAAAARR